MKKYLLIVMLLAAVVLILSACGDGAGSSNEGDEEEDLRGVPIDGTEAWFVCPNQKGLRKYIDNIVPVIGEDDDASYVHIFFSPHGITNLPDNRTFQISIVLEYLSDYNFAIDTMWQCAFDPYGTWARGSTADDYIEFIYPHQIYTFKCQPGRIFTGSNWDEKKWGNGKTSLSIPEMTGLCIQIPIEFEFETGAIQIHDVSFTNIGPGPAITGPHPPAN